MKDAALHYIQLSLLDQKLVQPFKKFLDIKEIDSSKFEEDVLFKESLFDKLIAFREQSLSLNDNVNLQIVLTPKVNDLIEKLEIEEMVIDFHGGFKKIRVLNDPTVEAQTFNEFKDGEKDAKELSLKCNLNFDDKKAKCFNFELTPNKIGNFSIQSINLKVKESSLEFKNQLKLVPSILPRLKWAKNSSTSFNKPFEYDIVPRTRAHLCFVVIPKQPKIEMKLHHSPRCYNGQIFPISVNFKNKGVDNIPDSIILMI
ncbi:unnamed protein product [Ambrosiozyma monospora]|uniref:Unnamed protein product n=1 Tax=Ambrosiozyma monospora TaxID=43982 RepID=A0ACB5TP01_AMBMO|nr:unnamed protein product [Ambrosiozyma monospora]